LELLGDGVSLTGMALAAEKGIEKIGVGAGVSGIGGGIRALRAKCPVCEQASE